MRLSRFIVIALCFLIPAQLFAGQGNDRIIPGAERLDLYLSALTGKKVGLVANHASRVKETHLVDTLISRGAPIFRIFSPEHGFRGNADAGAHVNSEVDPETGIQIVSLYGDNREPRKDQIADLDVVLFDLQDVGVRFYTYISTLTYVMKACAENDVDLIVLDRPNPNAHYIDGPVLENRFTSFVGMHSVPVVYGMTIGEYGLMVRGENWNNTGKCNMRVIPIDHYDHTSIYELPYKPSPNLPNPRSIYLYPSLCFFEGTVVSVGRGTDWPFQVVGHPDYIKGNFSFVPESREGAASNPKLKGRTCSGINFSNLDPIEIRDQERLDLSYLIDFYQALPNKSDFFNSYFNLLAGNASLKQMIIEGQSEKEIRRSWGFEIEKFRKIREKYLLYPDFEARIPME